MSSRSPAIPLVRVEPVAGVAVLGQDRADVPVVVHVGRWALGVGRWGPNQDMLEIRGASGLLRTFGAAASETTAQPRSSALLPASGRKVRRGSRVMEGNSNGPERVTQAGRDNGAGA